MSCATVTSLSFGLDGGTTTITMDQDTLLNLQMETKVGSTGYDWHLADDLPACLTASEPVYVQETTGGRAVPGSSSQKKVTFTASGACSGVIMYKYGRSWEKSADSQREVRIYVSVVSDEDGL
jgi:predicted secreted protein